MHWIRGQGSLLHFNAKNATIANNKNGEESNFEQLNTPTCV
jgi:hypothetical protein